jgi:hypothetical protein
MTTARDSDTPAARADADWGRPRPEEIPRPTHLPAAMAFGLTLFFWGLVTSPVVLGAGLVVVVVTLIGWVGEMRHGE